MTTQQPLSDKQQETLDAINSHWKEHCVAPTVRELSAHLGVSHNATSASIQRLREKGYLLPHAVGTSRNLVTKAVAEALRAL